jgi:hypothetical protein
MIACRKRAGLAEATHALDLLGQQRRECLVQARLDCRLNHALTAVLWMKAAVHSQPIARTLGAEYQVIGCLKSIQRPEQAGPWDRARRARMDDVD